MGALFFQLSMAWDFSAADFSVDDWINSQLSDQMVEAKGSNSSAATDDALPVLDKLEIRLQIMAKEKNKILEQASKDLLRAFPRLGDEGTRLPFELTSLIVGRV